MQQLDASLSPTGQQFSYQVTNDFGAFSPNSTFTSQYVGAAANGYYFDEVQGTVSAGQITLNGYSDLSVDPSVNVNLLTTLAYQRIQTLVTGSSKLTFAAARTQAETEVLAALNIPSGSYGNFDALDLSGTSDGDHILTAVSTLFVYGNASGPLSQLIAAFQSDIGANGVITNAATKAALSKAAQSVNVTAVAANLTAEYASEGLTFTAADITEWIAQSGDGVIGKFVFTVPDATPTSVFTLPASVVTQFAGMSVALSVGKLSINGTLTSGPVQFKSGDVVTVSPGGGTFPNGIVTVYMASGSTHLVKISFVSGLLSIAITPAAPSLPIGLTQQLKAMGIFSDTSTADLTATVVWSSGTPTIASVSPTTGLVTSLTAGSTVVTATSGSVAGSTTLTVTPAALQSIAIMPNPITTGIGIQGQLTATGSYSDATTKDVTASSNWTSTAPAIANVGPTTGIATGEALGSTSIIASIGSVQASVPLSVVANVWAPTGSMSVSRVGHTATLLANGKVLVTGGYHLSIGAPVPTTTAEIYDPLSGTWTLTGSLATERYGHTATLLTNGKVLVVGGINSSSNGGISVPSAEVYDPVAGTWSPTGSLTTGRYGHTATLLGNGKVLVAAGDLNTASGFKGGPLSSAEIYDPAVGTWSLTGSLPAALFDHTATLLADGSVLVAGGNPGNPAGGPLDAQLYNVTAGTWANTTSPGVDVVSHAATLLPNNTVLITGGETIVTNLTAVASNEIYDSLAGTWSTTGGLLTARFLHTATLLINGNVLIAGGESLDPNDNYLVLSSAELFDSVAGTTSVTGQLTTARYAHTATLLPNGAVLVVGGSNMGTSLSSAEIYYSVSTTN